MIHIVELYSEILQNPSDPDATFRTKYEDNIGYVENLVETFDEYAGVIFPISASGGLLTLVIITFYIN